jgi:hypothetical protein
VQKIAVCLFIDGLDEFQGGEMMLIGELRQLLRSPYIKICASSRPRNLFEGAFGCKDYPWKLALHLLTRGDMIRLAHTRLYEDDAFCELVDCEDRRQQFVWTIVDKSRGVFLWTVLVIREMIREANQAGTIDELKAHLEALPVELGGEKGMYQRIFERSDPYYRRYMARLLLIMLEPRPRPGYWNDVHFLYAHARDAAFATRECLGLDDKYRISWNKKAEAAAVPQGPEPELNDTSCRGLFLDCYQGRSATHPRGVNCAVDLISLVEDTRQQVRKWCSDFVDTNDKRYPNFLHRSVREYLCLPEIGKRMIDLAGREFDPVLTNCCLQLAHSRLRSYRTDFKNRERGFIGMMTRLCNVGHERRNSVRAILPKFEHIQDTKSSWVPAKGIDGRIILDGFWARTLCSSWLGDIVLHGGFGISRSSQAHAWFLLLVAREDLLWYCHEHWSQYRRQIGRPPELLSLQAWCSIRITG